MEVRRGVGDGEEKKKREREGKTDGCERVAGVISLPGVTASGCYHRAKGCAKDTRAKGERQDTGRVEGNGEKEEGSIGII